MKRTFFLLFFLIFLSSLLYACSPALPQVEVEGRSLVYQGKRFQIAPGLEVPASKIGKEIGITDAGVIICEIKGLPTDQWITAQDHTGLGTVYMEESLKEIDLKEFNPIEIQVINAKGWIEEKRIRDKKKVDQIVTFLQKARPVPRPKPDQIQMTRSLRFHSQKYKSVEYALTFIKDRQGQRYVRDERNGHVYEIKDLLLGEIGH